MNSNSGDPVLLGGIADMHVLPPIVNDNGNNTLGIIIDVDGDARPQLPSTVVDRGADEFMPLANDAVAIALLEVCIMSYTLRNRTYGGVRGQKTGELLLPFSSYSMVILESHEAYVKKSE